MYHEAINQYRSVIILRSLMKRIDRFCVNHPHFGIPNLMIYVVIGNALVWLFTMMDTTGTLTGLLSFSAYHILRGQLWRLVTFAFIPTTSGIWLVLVLYFYYFIGSTLEREWGTPKFTLYYISGLVFCIIYGFAAYFIFKVNVSIDMYYFNLSMFFVFATMFPETRVLLFFFIPIKIKWLAILDAVYFVIAVVTTRFPANLMPVVAVLNFLLFCFDDLVGFISPVRGRARGSTVNFRREAKRVRRQQAKAPYTRKCAVCGRTDTEYPDLEFRYCSKCAGYHCFCEDHINSHIHFTE